MIKSERCYLELVKEGVYIAKPVTGDQNFVPVPCPVCGKKVALMTSGEVMLSTIPSEYKNRKRWFEFKCAKCGSLIGVCG